MRLATTSSLVFVLLAGAAQAQTGGRPALVGQALSLSTDPTVYAYEFTMTEAGSRGMTIRGRINPAAPEGQRVELTHGEGKDVDLEEMDKRMEASADGDIWCDSMMASAVGPFAESAASGGKQTFSFTPSAGPDAEKEERQLFSRLSATATIGEASGQIQAFNARLNKSWKPNIMAKVNEFSMSGECALAPNGRAYTRSVTTRINGSALGQSFNSTSTRTITKIEPAR